MENVIIEETIRLEDNIIKAKNKYGTSFDGEIIMTKYFGLHDKNIDTLVCKNDNTIVLGKPRKRTNFKYCTINLIKHPYMDKYDIKLSEYKMDFESKQEVLRDGTNRVVRMWCFQMLCCNIL
jgi:hypothetical protein